MKSIPLTNGKYALVDDEDFERLTSRSWYCMVYKNGNCYARAGTRTNGKTKTLHMHREIMHPPNDKDVDHIDGNGLNNCKVNLRVCTRSQNHMNRRPYKKHLHGLKGVSFHRARGNWFAFIRVKGKSVYLGSFDSAIEAAVAYNRTATEVFGEFARLNSV